MFSYKLQDMEILVLDDLQVFTNGPWMLSKVFGRSDCREKIGEGEIDS